jgi:hypothetical protein
LAITAAQSGRVATTAARDGSIAVENAMSSSSDRVTAIDGITQTSYFLSFAKKKKEIAVQTFFVKSYRAVLID